MDIELMEVLTDLREHFHAPVNINSACRCVAHNKAIDGKPGSLHLQAKAADIWITGYSPDQVWSYLIDKYKGRYGIGRYYSFTHIDVRDYQSRW